MKVPFSNLWRRGSRNVGSPSQAVRPSAESATPARNWPAKGTAAMAWIGQGGTPRFVSARPQNSTAGRMVVDVGGPVAVHQPVWLILDDGTDFPGMVRSCEGKQGSFVVDIERVGGEGPVFTDASSPGSTHLKWIDPEGRLLNISVSLQNSQSGELQIAVSKFLPSATIVLLTGSDSRCLGIVRSCQQREDRWVAQMEVIGEAYSTPRSC